MYLNFLFFSFICFIIAFFSMLGYYFALVLVYKYRFRKKQKLTNQKVCFENGYTIKPLIIKK